MFVVTVGKYQGNRAYGPCHLSANYVYLAGRSSEKPPWIVMHLCHQLGRILTRQRRAWIRRLLHRASASNSAPHHRPFWPAPAKRGPPWYVFWLVPAFAVAVARCFVDRVCQHNHLSGDWFRGAVQRTDSCRRRSRSAASLALQKQDDTAERDDRCRWTDRLCLWEFRRQRGVSHQHKHRTPVSAPPIERLAR